MNNIDDLYIEKVADGLIKTECKKYGAQLWTLGRLTKRKQGGKCYFCGALLGTKGYRPVTNLSNRMKRICDRH